MSSERTGGRWKRRLLIALAIAGTVTVFSPYLLSWGLQRMAPGITFRGTTTEKLLYLTIDDAPSPQTEAILAVLDRHQVKATFFVTADHVTESSQIDALVKRGHRLGNHLRTTRPSSSLSLDTFIADFEACARILPEAGRTRWYRPSSDFGTAEQLAWVQQQGHHAVMGTVFPLDHWIDSPRMLEGLIDWLSIDGGIIILHDGRERGAVTAAVLDRVIPRLLRRGYRFETLDRLIPDQ